MPNATYRIRPLSDLTIKALMFFALVLIAFGSSNEVNAQQVAPTVGNGIIPNFFVKDPHLLPSAYFDRGGSANSPSGNCFLVAHEKYGLFELPTILYSNSSNTRQASPYMVNSNFDVAVARDNHYWLCRKRGYYILDSNLTYLANIDLPFDTAKAIEATVERDILLATRNSSSIYKLSRISPLGGFQWTKTLPFPGPCNVKRIITLVDSSLAIVAPPYLLKADRNGNTAMIYDLGPYRDADFYDDGSFCCVSTIGPTATVIVYDQNGIPKWKKNYNLPQLYVGPAAVITYERAFIAADRIAKGILLSTSINIVDSLHCQSYTQPNVLNRAFSILGLDSLGLQIDGGRVVTDNYLLDSQQDVLGFVNHIFSSFWDLCGNPGHTAQIFIERTTARLDGCPAQVTPWMISNSMASPNVLRSSITLALTSLSTQVDTNTFSLSPPFNHSTWCNICQTPNLTESHTIVDSLATFSGMVTDGDTAYWSFGDGTFDNDLNPTHIYAGHRETYKAYLFAENLCGKDSVCVQVDICPPIQIAYQQQYCARDSIFIDASNQNISTFEWTFDGTIVSNDSTIALTPTNIGIHNLMLVADSATCNDTILLSFEVLPAQTSSVFNYSMNVDTVNFVNTSSNASTYLWDFGDGSTDTTLSPSHVYSTNGFFQACLIAFGECATDTFCDSVNACVTPFFSLPDTICINDTVQLTSGNLISSNASWWENGTLLGTANPFIWVPSTLGTSTIELALDYPTCAPKTALSTQVIALPSADFSFNSVQNQTIFQNLSSNANSYFWDFGDGNASTGFSPNHVYSTPGNYIATLIASNACGSDTFLLPVSILVANEGRSNIGFKIYPNPNDGSFKIEALEKGCFDYRVMDALGRIVHRNQGCDTQQVDLNVPTGVYFVQISNENGMITRKILIE